MKRRACASNRKCQNDRTYVFHDQYSSVAQELSKMNAEA